MRQKQHILKAVSLTVVSAIAALALLTGCGGDAGGGSPTPPPASSKPASSTPSGGDGGSSSGGSSSGSSSSSSSTKPQGEVVWTFEDNATGATLKGYDASKGKPSGRVVLPSTDGKGQNVTAIGVVAFSGTGVTQIEIPDSVTVIEGSAFSDCSKLTSVTLPKNLKSLEWGTFSGCSSLTSIILPESLTEIHGFVFGNSGLKTLRIPDNVTSIGEYAFVYNKGLKEVYIPVGVQKLDSTTFNGCTNLEKIYYNGEKSKLEIIKGDNDEDGWKDKIVENSSPDSVSVLSLPSLLSLF